MKNQFTKFVVFKSVTIAMALILLGCGQSSRSVSEDEIESAGEPTGGTNPGDVGSNEEGSGEEGGGEEEGSEEEGSEQEGSEEEGSEQEGEIVQEAGILFGFWGLNGYVSAAGLLDVSSRFKATVFQVASENPHYTVHTLLPMVRASGMKVTLRLTGDHNIYTTSNNFDLTKWKDKLSEWEGSGIQEFIDDGTLVGHMLLDDIWNFTGTDPTAAELDEMARYSQELMPGLMAFVREKANTMPEPAGGEYLYVDAIVNQYRAADGDALIYAQTQHDRAQELGLEVINGLNICDGGDGSSGKPGWKAGKFAMTADEIASYGEALLSVPDVKMFLMWEYDGLETWSDGSIGSDYFDQAELQEALYGLGLVAEGYK